MAFAQPGLPGHASGMHPAQAADAEVAALEGQQLLDGNGDDALAENLRRIGLSSPAPAPDPATAAAAVAAAAAAAAAGNFRVMSPGGGAEGSPATG